MIGFFYFTDQSGTLFTSWLENSNMSFRTSQRTCELRNEVRNICGQSFMKSTVKSSPGWGIFHFQLAQGPCISLQVVSRHPGIYTIITNQIKCPGVFPGGMVTPGIDSCITNACIIRNTYHMNARIIIIRNTHYKQILGRYKTQYIYARIIIRVLIPIHMQVYCTLVHTRTNA